MEISAFAERLLRTGSLEDKLWFPDEGISAFSDLHRHLAADILTSVNEPGRPPSLRFGSEEKKKTAFPTSSDLKQESSRGIVLHFFANHELLAMELMALALLKFPDAPDKFRLGIVQTIAEEQIHMRLYMQRMQDYGVPFGDVSVNRFFWDLLKDMRTPLDYVTRMSLTFEQANLDFSLHYQQLFANLGDTPTADILQRVYSEEIGHVKYGVAWFNRWRDQDSSDWKAYNDLLPYPMTPSRAKGIGFDREGRRSAGLSETFIEELFVYQHSKGRPPVVFFFNPSAEMEALYPLASFTEPAPVAEIRRDLASLMMFLAHSDDVVLTEERPSTEFLSSCIDAGLKLPQFATWKDISDRTVTRFEPWGRTKYSMQQIAAFAGRILEPNEAETDRKFFSKQWCAENITSRREFADFPVKILTTEASVEETAREHLTCSETPLALKAPFGSSGRNMLRIMRPGIDSNQAKWVSGVLKVQGALIAEPWVKKISDLSVQVDISNDQIKILGTTRFITDKRGQYIGHFLGKKFFNFDSAFHRALHELSIDKQLNAAALKAAELMRSAGYLGPAGIDAFLWQDHEGQLRLRPCVEINPRYTMGRIALEIEKKLISHKGHALWLHIGARMAPAFGCKELSAVPERLKSKYGDQIFFTNDPRSCRSVLTTVFTGTACEDALQTILPAMV